VKTARQIKSLWLAGHISFRAAHTALRAIGYSDTEADDILDSYVPAPADAPSLLPPRD